MWANVNERTPAKPAFAAMTFRRSLRLYVRTLKGD